MSGRSTRFVDWSDTGITVRVPQVGGSTEEVVLTGFDNRPFKKNSWHYAVLSIDFELKRIEVGFQSDGIVASESFSSLTDDRLMGR